MDGARENAERIINVLTEFGFGTIDLRADDFAREDHVIQPGRPPRRIDIMTSLRGVDFSTCYASRVTEDVDGVAIPIIGLDDLRRNKRAVGRHQDLADLDNLQP